MISFDVPGKPIPQPRPKFRAMAIGGRAYVESSHPIHQYRATIQLQAKAAMTGDRLSGPLAVVIEFVFPMPMVDRRSKSCPPRRNHDKKPDVDNCTKGVLDACNGILWTDDGQVAQLTAVKYYGAQDELPHTRVSVSPLPPPADMG